MLTMMVMYFNCNIINHKVERFVIAERIALSTDSKALPAGSEALPTGSKALPADSEALTAGSDVLSAD